MTGASSDRDCFVSTGVVLDKGRWMVVLDVIFADGAVHHEICSYPTRARAELAARLMGATAERDYRIDEGVTEW